MKKKFAIYDRTVSNKAELLGNKVSDIERHVNKLDGIVIKVFTDLNHDGVSARIGFKDFMQFVDTGRVDAVAVFSLDRLSTSGVSCITDLLGFREFNVDFVTVLEDFNTAFAQQKIVLWPLLNSLQRMNKEAHSSSVKRGMLRAAALGKTVGRPGVPFEQLKMAVGFMKEAKDDPVEAYRPWQIQAKCKFSAPMYYSIRDAIEVIELGEMDASIVSDKTRVGASTAENLITILI